MAEVLEADSDDAEEEDGSVDLGSSDLELTVDGSEQTIGMRFNGVAIAPGATVVNASVQFEVDETSSEDTSLDIWGEANDNPPTFTSATGNIMSRPKTNSVPWNPVPWMTVDAARKVFTASGLNFEEMKQLATDGGFRPVSLNATITMSIENKSTRWSVSRIDGCNNEP